jgi:hypothetical protein
MFASSVSNSVHITGRLLCRRPDAPTAGRCRAGGRPPCATGAAFHHKLHGRARRCPPVGTAGARVGASTGWASGSVARAPRSGVPASERWRTDGKDLAINCRQFAYSHALDLSRVVYNWSSIGSMPTKPRSNLSHTLVSGSVSYCTFFPLFSSVHTSLPSLSSVT